MQAFLVHVLDKMREEITRFVGGGEDWMGFLKPIVILKEHEVTVESVREIGED